MHVKINVITFVKRIPADLIPTYLCWNNPSTKKVRNKVDD